MEESSHKRILEAWESHCRKPRIVGKFVTRQKGGVSLPFLVVMLVPMYSAISCYYHDLLETMA